ncbi:MAG: UDP-2,3-diacylglucosamine diphosphatase [Proteobacteria bacterium]|nr:UDP-2,3-diacylglucosamine diphosphatase [Pseudomonadota bacterium]
MATAVEPRELAAPPAWSTIDFISDLHLAEDTPRAFDAWRDYLVSTPADAVFILGDLFEAWVGDDARDAEFEARCIAVLRAASARRWLGFMVGNRDFLFGRDALEAAGMNGLADPTLLIAFGQRMLLSHGDALCIDDVAYQQVRRTVRHPAWQAAALARPIAERRAMARAMRTESERYQAGRPPSQWFDADRATMLAWLAAARAPALIHGHTHRPGDEDLDAAHRRHVLSDWSLDHGAPERAEVLRWQAGGLSRLPLAQASAPR